MELFLQNAMTSDKGKNFASIRKNITPFPVSTSVQGYQLEYQNDHILKTVVTKLECLSHFSIDSKYSDLVHIWELCNDQHKHCQCVKKEHRMLIVCCV